MAPLPYRGACPSCSSHSVIVIYKSEVRCMDCNHHFSDPAAIREYPTVEIDNPIPQTPLSTLVAMTREMSND